jgi:uncharacterized repeat protein (TIGR01451 family)
MKVILTILSLMCLTFPSKAQTVTIPDPNFVAYLQAQSTCMSGNQMDLACAQTIIYLNVANLGITDLSGIEYCTSLQTLWCDYNNLTVLPPLPSSLSALGCSHNQLASLPFLPAGLTYLTCGNNLLTSLPPLPGTLDELYCSHNQLSSLPPLPGLIQFACDSNNISCFPPFPNTIGAYPNIFWIRENPFSCLPNYISAMDAATLSYPLCVTADTINNPDGCNGSKGIWGHTYVDSTANCVNDSADRAIANIPLNLYSSGGVLLEQTYSIANGIYDFYKAPGVYTVIVDTVGIPFISNCFYPGIDSTITLSATSPLAGNVNFDIGCKPGFDIGVQSVLIDGWVFPGLQHHVNVTAGDLSHWFSLNCADGLSGQVKIIVTGPVTYSGIEPGALTPIVSGNIFTYTIADFGSINNSVDFGLLFTTDTTANTGDKICVNIELTSYLGDNDTSNNTYEYCYTVVNSHDPNMKEVYPVNVEPGYQDWFTYTVHFQNTGAAPAMNIRVSDTLSNNLDLSTFRIVNYSHDNVVTRTGNILNARFPHIMLPDSTSNPEGSKGFIQYRVKPKPGLANGTTIENTAYIYFDYNTPVITNTTINQFVEPLAVGAFQHNSEIHVYPNPGTGKFNISLSAQIYKELKVEVFNLLGELILRQTFTGNTALIDLSGQTPGVYILRVNNKFNQRLIKQ